VTYAVGYFGMTTELRARMREESFRFDANAVWSSNEIGERSKFFENEEEAVTYLVMCP
jgi:hypothetical protein